jgi:hypothetical protein
MEFARKNRKGFSQEENEGDDEKDLVGLISCRGGIKDIEH